MTDRGRVARHLRFRRVGSALLAAIALGGVVSCGSSGSSATADRRAEVEARGSTVMPFDQERTTHVFRATPTGGVQQVVAKRANDTGQIGLIRAHLRKEARRFSAGNFADPMAIGARITYRATDPALISALHDWFDAQLMDHGANAHG